MDKKALKEAAKAAKERTLKREKEYHKKVMEAERKRLRDQGATEDKKIFKWPYS